MAEKRGTWINWEHLKSCGKLLARCRYTLKYTYPKAYMMPTGKEKDLFEYQQGLENQKFTVRITGATTSHDLEF